MEKYKTGLDLTKVAPRSPRIRINGFAIIARTIDKCRALVWGNIGQYHFDCPLDNQLFSFKGISGNDFKAYVSLGHSDQEIADWLEKTGTPATPTDILKWSDKVESNNYSDNADKKKWLESENIRLGIDKEATLFDYLEADDKDSFKS